MNLAHLTPTPEEQAELVGVPFQYKGRDEKAFDCYGLVRHLYKNRGFAIPDYHSPSEQNKIAALMGSQLTLWAPCEKQAGATVVFKIAGLVTHCGMMLDDDRFIHTWEKSGGVVIERLDQWQKRIYGFYRYVGI